MNYPRIASNLSRAFALPPFNVKNIFRWWFHSEPKSINTAMEQPRMKSSETWMEHFPSKCGLRRSKRLVFCLFKTHRLSTHAARNQVKLRWIYVYALIARTTFLFFHACAFLLKPLLYHLQGGFLGLRSSLAHACEFAIHSVSFFLQHGLWQTGLMGMVLVIPEPAGGVWIVFALNDPLIFQTQTCIVSDCQGNTNLFGQLEAIQMWRLRIEAFSP